MIKQLLNQVLRSTRSLWEWWFRSMPRARPEKSIIILRLDRLGDYILWRNFLKEIRLSEKYRDYTITLCGNSAWIELAKILDSQWVDYFIEIDLYRFHHPEWMGYRFKRLLEINKRSYEVLLHPTFSRSPESDEVVRLIRAAAKTGQEGDTTNQDPETKRVGDSYYSVLVTASTEAVFEFDRNRNFFVNVLGNNDLPDSPVIESYQNIPKEPVCVFFPGASHPARQWSARNLGDLSKRIWEKYQLKCWVLGTAAEKGLAAEIVSRGGGYVEDFMACSMKEMLSRVASSVLVVANDSAGYHLGACLGIPTICITLAANNGRFVPYPGSYGKHVTYCYPKSAELVKSMSPGNDNGSTDRDLYPIDSISVNQVWEAVQELLNQNISVKNIK